MTQIPSTERLLEIIELQNAIAAARADLSSVMKVVVDRAGVLTGATGAVVELVDGDELVYRAASGSAESSLGARISRRGSLSGLCVQEGVPLRSDDSTRDDRVDKEMCRKVGVASMICVPLVHDRMAIGVLKVLSSKPRAFNDDDTAILVLLANIIATSLHQAREFESVRHESLHDALTGLGNRRAFDAALSEALDRCRRYDARLSLALLDLDGFKGANDRYGHAAGDAVLKEVATILKHTTRPSDVCFRFGGDEFAILFPGTDDAGARMAVDRCVAHVDVARLAEGMIGISAGIAEAHTQTATELVEIADAALYEVKARKGRRSVH